MGEGFREDLSTHTLMHQGVRRFSCHICSKSFTQKVTRDVHLVIHTGNYRFDCQQCSRKFSTKHKLRAHMKSHLIADKEDGLKQLPSTEQAPSLPKSYTCTVLECPGRVKSFTDYNLFVKHNQRHHNPNKQYFSCLECGFQFVERSSLKHHIAMNHSLDGPTLHRCFFCDKRFTMKSKLKRHVAIHLEEPQHRCQVCGKRYYRGDALKKHEKRHRVTETTCRICEKICQDSESLQKHVKLHVSPDHSCLQCGLTFTTRTAMDYHMAKHENKFSFTCTICGKKFVRKCHYTAHVTTHNLATVKCPTCGKAFKNESYLKRHIGRMHGGSDSNKDQESMSNLDELDEIIDSSSKTLGL